MTRVLPISLSIILFLFIIAPVSAQGANPTVTISPTDGVTTRSAKNPQLINLQERATKEIDRRLAALNLVLTKISAVKKLSATEKTALTTQVQAEISSLTALKTKIAGATDLVTLKVDVATLVTSYRVFALFIPKIHLLAGADVLGQTIDTLTTLSAKLDTRIKEAETSGKVITNLTKLHTEMNESLAEAKKQYESIITNVTPLKPEDYPGNKTTLQDGRELLRTGRKNAGDAAKDARDIITALKAFRPAITDASASAIPLSTR